MILAPHSLVAFHTCFIRMYSPREYSLLSLSSWMRRGEYFPGVLPYFPSVFGCALGSTSPGSAPSASAPPASTPLLSLSFWMPWGVLPRGVLPLRVAPPASTPLLSLQFLDGEYSPGECSLCECSPGEYFPPANPQLLDVGSTPPASAPASCLETYLVLRLASEDYKCRKTREVYFPQPTLNFWIPVGSTPPASAPPATTPSETSNFGVACREYAQRECSPQFLEGLSVGSTVHRQKSGESVGHPSEHSTNLYGTGFPGTGFYSTRFTTLAFKVLASTVLSYRP